MQKMMSAIRFMQSSTRYKKRIYVQKISILWCIPANQSDTHLNSKSNAFSNFRISDYVKEMHEYWKPLLIERKDPPDFFYQFLDEDRFSDPEREHYDFRFLQTAPKEEHQALFQKERTNVIVRHLGIDPKKVIYLKHHDAHAYYAYYASPLDKDSKTAVVTADGWGDGENGAVWVAEKGRMKKVMGTSMCNMARIYRYITLVLGMKPFEHEYKVMGLAPYAHDYLRNPAREVFEETLDVSGIDFKWKNKPSDLYFYFRDKLEGIRFDGIAGGLQDWLERILVTWTSNILQELKADALVYSGGLSMNVKANKHIADVPELKTIFVPPSGGDESTAIGAAYAIYVENNIDPKPLTDAYLGYTLTDFEINNLLKEVVAEDAYVVKQDSSNEEVARLLSENKIIARCVGRMEFGARALGNRSILCNPSNVENIQRLNEKIKFRDFWMPFTPSILDYRSDDYLVNPKGLQSPYMTVAFDTKDQARADIIAALHPSDFTARPQILTERQNPEYYNLIKAFEKITGIGAVLNTSFNLHGEPIVCDAKDAWHTFTHSSLDGLLLNNVLILKK